MPQRSSRRSGPGRPGSPPRTRPHPAAYGPRRLRTDAGQTTVEFLGMLPLILLVLVLVWQFVLVGYTFTLAGNAADEAARACALGEDAGSAAQEDLPGAWQAGSGTTCDRGAQGQMSRATVDLQVPVLFPGSVPFPFDVTGEAGAVSEAAE